MVGGGSSGGYVTSLLPAVEVDISQPTPGEGPRKLADGDSESTKTVVVAFVGGVTHSEIAALRKVAAADESKHICFVYYESFAMANAQFIYYMTHIGGGGCFEYVFSLVYSTIRRSVVSLSVGLLYFTFILCQYKLVPFLCFLF